MSFETSFHNLHYLRTLISSLNKRFFTFSVVHLLLDDVGDDTMWTEMTLGFEPPTRLAPLRSQGEIKDVPPEVWESVPPIICRTVSETLGPDVPLDPEIAFRYFLNGRLPEFVVSYFVNFQQARRNTSKGTIFSRAFHYLELFRNYMMVTAGFWERPDAPPSSDDPLAADPAVVDHGAAVDPSGPNPATTPIPAVSSDDIVDKTDEDGPPEKVLAADPGFAAAHGLLDEDDDEEDSEADPLDVAFLDAEDGE